MMSKILAIADFHTTQGVTTLLSQHSFYIMLEVNKLLSEISNFEPSKYRPSAPYSYTYKF